MKSLSYRDSSDFSCKGHGGERIVSVAHLYLSQDYITMAEAKGLSERRVMFSYAARNAILPSLTGFAMSLGFILGGSLLVEIVFSYPGMGFLLLSAVNQRDYPLMQGIFLLIMMAVLIANFTVDIVYVILDPRALNRIAHRKTVSVEINNGSK